MRKFILSLAVAFTTFVGITACQNQEVAQKDSPQETESYHLDIPLGLENLEPQIPADNPLTAEKVALGKQLYFDTRLSKNRTVACVSCHNPRLGFADGMAVSTGINGQKGGRSAPTIINRVFSQEQFWDGRAATLEEQAKGPIANPIEMGFTHELAAERIGSIDGYRKQFKVTFGTEKVSIDRIAKAIAAYERTIMSGNAPYDQYQAGDSTAMSPSAVRGMELFMGQARCASCHAGPNFTDELYHNIGIGADKTNPDPGRFAVTNQQRNQGAFKTPTLRDIALTAPYFHDGSAQTLMEVVDYYNEGGTAAEHLDPLMTPLDLNEQEEKDLVAFMESLTGEISLNALAPSLPQE